MRLHLDPIGGISGDMFIAAMLSAFPDAQEPLQKDWQDLGLNEHVTLDLQNVREKGFACKRAHIVTSSDAPPTAHWSSIRQTIECSPLRQVVKERAIAIFELLAEAEADCHGVPKERVHFHEIADWDSLADIVGAASLLEYCQLSTASVGPLPIGHGRIRTQHGLIAAPAPATVELLKGFTFFDDGGAGERITPTGAAILKHLATTSIDQSPRGTLLASGMGAGQMQIEGIPNLLRILVFNEAVRETERVSLIRFEVDDMTPEEVSVSLDHLREKQGVLDASYLSGFGKKGRIQFAITILVKPEWCEEIVDACFTETSTIGLRIEQAVRHTLERSHTERAGLPIKQVQRPNGRTIKVESDAIASIPTLSERRKRAIVAERSDGASDA